MGYELKMFVVEKRDLVPDVLVCVGDEVYNLYFEGIDGEYKYCYYSDNDTKTYFNEKPKIVVSSRYSSLIAVFDFCKAPGLKHTGICKFEESDGLGCSIYDPMDGNKYIGLDRYGSYRKFVPIEVVIQDLKEVIEEEIKKGYEPYRRYLVGLDLLNSIRQNFRGDGIGCLFYGY